MAPDPIDLCTVEQVKAARRDTSTTFDVLTQAMVTAASRRVMTWTGRRITPLDTAATVRSFDAVAVEGAWRIDDLSAPPTAVTIEDAEGVTVATLDVADVVCLPRNRDAWQPIDRLLIRPSATAPAAGQIITVTGLWGWPAIPADVRQAAIETACEWLKLRQALSEPSPDQFEPGTPPIRDLPWIARNMLLPYRRLGVV